jgi:serine/threonine-protein kinase
MMIGRMLGGRYEVLEKVGGGGMSLVYRARDLYLNRIVAIKALREHLTNDEEFVARFRREAQAVASLSHTNIVSIYDVGQDKDLHYLVMEMVEGQNLKEIILEKGKFNENDAVEIAKQICEALEHAHKQKIIHCDIKPHNIILTKDGKAKVTDFGIARAVTTATITHTGSIMGSVHYFSPEQAKGEIADEKSDIYSMGVVLYEMLTGKLPFEGESPISIALKKINNDSIPPRNINPDIGEAMEKVILRAMDRNPFKRYDSVHELKQDINSAYLYNRVEYVPSETEDTINISPIAKRKTKKNDLTAPLKVWTWIMISLIVIGFILGMYISANVLSKGEVTVPDIVEMNVSEAQTLLKQLELTPSIERKINHPTIEEGMIVSQEPKPKVIVKKKSEVKFVVSKGPNMVIVPNVLDSSLLSAEVALSNEELRLGVVTRVYHEQISSGKVVRQEPAAGKEIIQGSTVNLIVSKGPEPIWINMPVVTRLNIQQAESVLQNYNLVLGVVQPETSYEYAEDIVIRQDPGANSEILQGSVVNLVISAGPGPLGSQSSVSITLPSSGKVKIVVDDEKSREIVYEEYHYDGETIQRNISYQGRGFIEVYIDNKLIKRKEVG